MTATPPSIEARVARLQRTAILVSALCAIGVGVAVGMLTALHREDRVTLGVARIMAADLAEATAETLELRVREETAEQTLVGRRVEVYQGSRRRGADGGILAPGPIADDTCTTMQSADRHYRVCAVAARTRDGVVLRVLAAAALGPLLASLGTLAFGMAAAGLLCAGFFSLRSRRRVRAALLPLSAFRAELAALRLGSDGAAVHAEQGALEVDQLAATFNQLLADLAAARQRERRFLCDASHELRTPLTRLRAQLELARDAAVAPAAPLTAASASCERLIRMTESILALARSELPAGEAVDLGDLLQDEQRALRTSDPAAAARLRLELAEDVLVRADQDLLRLCVGNLIHNALSYTRGPVKLGVRTPAPGQTELTVTDEGPGLPPAERERVFAPFYRGARPMTSGTGLGLPLALHVAVSYGGALVLEPAPGGVGLRAVLTLPAWRDRKSVV